MFSKSPNQILKLKFITIIYKANYNKILICITFFLSESSSCCCCCCYVTSVMSNSVQPHRRLPSRLPRPWDSPGKNTGVGRHFLLQCIKVKSEREVSQSCLTLSDPRDCSHQALPSMGFSRQEYWSGVPSLSPAYYTIL